MVVGINFDAGNWSSRGVCRTLPIPYAQCAVSLSSARWDSNPHLPNARGILAYAL